MLLDWHQDPFLERYTDTCKIWALLGWKKGNRCWVEDNLRT